MLREIVVGSQDYGLELDLRRRVLRWPLGLDFTAEQIAEEAEDIHLGCFEGDFLVATLVLTPHRDEIKMRQVAVEPDFQGRGIGRQLVLFSERIARERGFARMVLHARDNAVPFYLRLGYELEGEEFEEVTIPHRAMGKALAAGGVNERIGE